MEMKIYQTWNQNASNGTKVCGNENASSRADVTGNKNVSKMADID